MLKQLAIALSLILPATLVRADDVPPLGPVKLVLVTDLHTLSAFELAPVPLRACEATAPAYSVAHALQGARLSR